MRKLLVYILITVLYSCQKKEEPELVFEEAQPNTSKDLPNFRKEIQGKYINPEDSSIISISPLSITKTETIQWDFLRSEIDSGFESDPLDNNLLMEQFGKLNIKAAIRGDSIFSGWIHTDTLFMISSNHILRQLKGYYFLNKKTENGWSVLRIDLQKRKYLHFSKIDPLDSLEKFESITPIHKTLNDSGAVIEYRIKPSKRELKKLMKQDAFIPTDKVYMRMEK